MSRNRERKRENERRFNRKHPLHRVFSNMMTRTGVWKGGNIRNVADYAMRGITVCSEWREFHEFEKWALANGWSKGLDIDRINNNGNYEPSNCRFVDRSTNLLNRRNTVFITYKGERRKLYDIWKESSNTVSYKIFNIRVNHLGWDVERALTTPLQNPKHNLKYYKNK